jgi:hypothetical protein
MSGDTHTTPDHATLAEDVRVAKRAHAADRAATQDEATAAEESREKFADNTQDVAEHEKSMAKRGAEIKGERDQVAAVVAATTLESHI